MCVGWWSTCKNTEGVVACGREYCSQDDFTTTSPNASTVQRDDHEIEQQVTRKKFDRMTIVDVLCYEKGCYEFLQE